MKTFANIIKTKEQFNSWAVLNEREKNENNGQIIIINIYNDRPRRLWFESLENDCKKAAQKYGGLDLDYLAGCSTLKAITRAARYAENNAGGCVGMVEDRAARIALAARIWQNIFI